MHACTHENPRSTDLIVAKIPRPKLIHFSNRVRDRATEHIVLELHDAEITCQNGKGICHCKIYQVDITNAEGSNELQRNKH